MTTEQKEVIKAFVEYMRTQHLPNNCYECTSINEVLCSDEFQALKELIDDK